MKENIILVDCDGVLCDWEYAFNSWMQYKGYELKDPYAYGSGKKFGLSYDVGKAFTREFNDSAAIAFLPQLRDSVYYVKRLYKMHGYRFRVITSLSNNIHAQKLRTQNLNYLFGEKVFDSYTYLGCGDDKDEALEPYRNSECYWIEDKIKNAILGQNLGLNSILVGHSHNANYTKIPKDQISYVNSRNYTKIPRYSTWKEIYHHITD